MSDIPLSGTVAERLARVEAAIGGLHHSQNLTIAATIGVGAILAGFIIAFGIYGLQRIDAVDAKLNAVEARIDQKFDAFATRFSEESARNRQELTGIATAISNAITAARQPPPGSAVPAGPSGGGSPSDGRR